MPARKDRDFQGYNYTLKQLNQYVLKPLGYRLQFIGYEKPDGTIVGSCKNGDAMNMELYQFKPLQDHYECRDDIFTCWCYSMIPVYRWKNFLYALLKDISFNAINSAYTRQRRSRAKGKGTTGYLKEFEVITENDTD